MKNKFISFLIFLSMACNSSPDLNAAANFLMLVSDEEKAITNSCNLSPKEALAMLSPLHALIDRENKKEINIKIKAKNELITEANLTAKWFCDSELFKKLKAEALVIAPAS